MTDNPGTVPNPNGNRSQEDANRAPEADEIRLARFSNSLILLNVAGLAVNLVLWLLRRKKSQYVRFHLLQSILFQMLGIAITLVLWTMWAVIYGLTVIYIYHISFNLVEYDSWSFWIGVVLAAIPVGFTLLWTYYGGAHVVFDNKALMKNKGYFVYPFLTKWLRNRGNWQLGKVE